MTTQSKVLEKDVTSPPRSVFPRLLRPLLCVKEALLTMFIAVVDDVLDLMEEFLGQVEAVKDEDVFVVPDPDVGDGISK